MYLAAFPKKSEYEKMRTRLDKMSLAYEVVNPAPGYGLVGIPAIAMEQEVRSLLASNSVDDLVCSGWIEYRRTTIEIQQDAPQQFQKDIFGNASIMVPSKPMTRGAARKVPGSSRNFSISGNTKFLSTRISLFRRMATGSISHDSWSGRGQRSRSCL